MAARTARNFNVAQHPVMQDDPDALTPEEQAAAQAEAQGQPLDTPSEDQQQPPSQEKPVETAPEGQEQQPPKDKDGFVPRSRLNEVISERNELRQKFAETQQTLARLDERGKTMRQLQADAEAAAQRQKQAAERPDPAIDPQGAEIFDLKQSLAELRTQVPQLQQQFQQTTQQTQEQMAIQRLANWEQADVARVSAIHPDYNAAYNHLRNTRIELNKALGYNEQQAAALWDLERAAYVKQAADNGVSIAEFAYTMAQKVGYQPPQANGNGGTQPRQVTPQVMPNGKDRIEQIHRAQQVQGLGGRQSSAESEEFNHVANMTAQQFDQFLEKFGPNDEWTDIKNTNPKLWSAIQAKFIALG